MMKKVTAVKTLSLAMMVSACVAAAVIHAGAASNLVVHEWGTFTSVQGANGKLLPWQSLLTSELPGFVYDWSKPGLNRGSLIRGKGFMVTLQRMETPVIYFYTDQPIIADVSVDFPQGFITEWYPQATQIGPTFAVNSNAPSDGLLGQSRVIWRNLEIVPNTNSDLSLQKLLPQDASGSHYFSARATSANLVHADLSYSNNQTSEFEKFIFYRGAGNFKTPLRVTIGSNSVVSIENTGAQTLAHLFLLSIHDGRGAFSIMDELGASNSVTWLQLSNDSAEHWRQFALPEFQAEISAQMQAALASEGLFPNEARAMVNTWKNSWFTEDGVRVLYVLPRPWTDATLPMTLNPQPRELTRVMVGRAEIITPVVEMNLFQLLTKAQNGDSSARHQASVELKKLGRFAEPALQLANTHANRTNIFSFGYQLVNPAQSNLE
jgi:hypothetical protein